MTPLIDERREVEAVEGVNWRSELGIAQSIKIGSVTRSDIRNKGDLLKKNKSWDWICQAIRFRDPSSLLSLSLARSCVRADKVPIGRSSVVFSDTNDCAAICMVL